MTSCTRSWVATSVPNLKNNLKVIQSRLQRGAAILPIVKAMAYTILGYSPQALEWLGGPSSSVLSILFFLGLIQFSTHCEPNLNSSSYWRGSGWFPPLKSILSIRVLHSQTRVFPAIALSVSGWMALWGTGLTSGSQPSPSPIEYVESARVLQGQYREREALYLYLQALEVDPDHFEAVCGASYLYGQVGKLLRDKHRQREYYQRSQALARQAFAARPDDPEANLVMAWSHGGISLISGVREKVATAWKVKEHVDRTLQSRPGDHRAWYILANLNYQVGTAGFLQKSLARVLGGVPKQLSLEKAIMAYRKAVEIRPDFILYRYELARALKRSGLKHEASEYLRLALTLTPRFEDDSAVLRECREFLYRMD